MKRWVWHLRRLNISFVEIVTGILGFKVFCDLCIQLIGYLFCAIKLPIRRINRTEERENTDTKTDKCTVKVVVDNKRSDDIGN